MAETPLSRQAIAIDYTAAYEQGAGIGRLVRDLVAHLGQEDDQTVYRLFVAGAQQKQLPTLPGDNFSWRSSRISPRWFARLWHKARFYLPIQIFTGQVALFHATDFTLPPTLPKTKTILTVHDLSYVRAPETAHPAQKAYLDKAVPWSVKRANHVIADSHATKDDLIALYHTPAEKISVLHSGINSLYRPITDKAKQLAVRQKYNIPAEVPYLFSIGTVQPRKNYGRAAQALHALGERYQDIHMVIAGGKGWLEADIYQQVEKLDMADRVHFIGYVDDNDVPTLYSAALCTVYVSLYEGFGFPILESMACDTPVLTSTVSSIPEVAGDAALMVNPYNIDEIAAALKHILDNPAQQQKMIEAGREQVKQFTWKKAAKALLAIYHRVLNE